MPAVVVVVPVVEPVVEPALRMRVKPVTASNNCLSLPEFAAARTVAAAPAYFKSELPVKLPIDVTTPPISLLSAAFVNLATFNAS